MDRYEKVIKAYDVCKHFQKKCSECPYDKICYHDQFCLTAIKDAIILLQQYHERIADLGERIDSMEETISDLNEQIQMETDKYWE